MFQENKDLLVIEPVKVSKYHEMAEAIRLGALTVEPGHSFKIESGCVLCCLAVGLGKPAGMSLSGSMNLKGNNHFFGKTRKFLNEHYGRDLITEIEEKYELGNQTFTQIADWLDSL